MSNIKKYYSKINYDVDRTVNKKALKFLENKSKNFKNMIISNPNMSSEIKKETKSEYKNTFKKIKIKSKKLK